MPSIVWQRDPEEAYANPYEYPAQDQFVREARKLLRILAAEYDKHLMTFHRDEHSQTKAIWMLQMDALDSISDCLELIESKRHRLGGRLFRDIVETLDLAAYFSSGTTESETNLEKWFQNEVIPHRIYRDYIRRSVSLNAANDRRDLYSELSKFTHRTYRALLKSYSIGAKNMLVYDGHRRSTSLVLPHTIAAYLAILAGLIMEFCDEASRRGILSSDAVDQAKRQSLEADTIPRRFYPVREIEPR